MMVPHDTPRVVDPEADPPGVEGPAVPGVAPVADQRLRHVVVPPHGVRVRRVAAELDLDEAGEVIREAVVALEEEQGVGQPPQELEAALPLARGSSLKRSAPSRVKTYRGVVHSRRTSGASERGPP